MESDYKYNGSLQVSQKCARKPENQSCQKWTQEGQGKSETSPRTYQSLPEYKSGGTCTPLVPMAEKLGNQRHFQQNGQIPFR